MFERGKINDDLKRKVPVALILNDGTKMQGVISGARGDLGDILAEAHPFLEIVTAKGIGVYLSKQSISQIMLNQLPTADQLKRKLGSLSVDDPYAVLGVGPDADEAECARAYRELTKAYHPDRLSSMNLPAEIVEYGATMQRRINRAYDQIKKSTRAETGSPALTQQLYERRPHWVKEQAA